MLLGTGEYGTRRIIRSSVGWVEFEFWAEWSAWVGVYGDDGWLQPRDRGEPIEATEQGASAALAARGIPSAEADELAALVINERLSRIATASS